MTRQTQCTVLYACICRTASSRQLMRSGAGPAQYGSVPYCSGLHCKLIHYSSGLVVRRVRGRWQEGLCFCLLGRACRLLFLAVLGDGVPDAPQRVDGQPSDVQRPHLHAPQDEEPQRLPHSAPTQGKIPGISRDSQGMTKRTSRSR